MKNKMEFRSKRGEGYIDIVISVFVLLMVIVLALNVFSFLSLKQDMDYFAKEMIFTATAFGRTTGEVDDRYLEVETLTGISADVTWQAQYYSESEKTVQYGDTITVTLTYEATLKGFGTIPIPITLTAKHSGLSQRYWK